MWKKDDGGDTLQTTAAWEKSLKLTYVKFALYPLKQHTQRQQGFRSNNQKQLGVFAKNDENWNHECSSFGAIFENVSGTCLYTLWSWNCLVVASAICKTWLFKGIKLYIPASVFYATIILCNGAHGAS